LSYCDDRLVQKQAVFKLYSDHLIRIDEISLYQENPIKAMTMAQVLMPITQVQLDMYSFVNNEQINDFLKYSLMLSYN
jgi:hypothetical protein